MADNPIRFYDDDGTEITPDLVRKPTLCTSSAKDDDPDEEPLCPLTRYDQRTDEEFQCDAYVANGQVKTR
jgi:hypothetical protein